MIDNIIPFRKPDDYDWGDMICYATLYRNGVTFSMPDGADVNKDIVADAMFDASFSVLQEADDSIVLISLGSKVLKVYRRKGIFETPEQCAWLARRFDDVYKDITGRTRNPIKAFFNRLNPFRKGSNK
jgi:hypothetical protein